MKPATRDELLRQIFNERCMPLLQNKGHDYSGDEDSLQNLRRHGVKGIVVRLGDKYERLDSLVWHEREARVADEKVEDTLIDIVNYALLALVLNHEKR